MTNAAKIRRFFEKYPNASAKEAADKFGVKLAYVYVVRSQAKKRKEAAVKKPWVMMHVSTSNESTAPNIVSTPAAPAADDMVNHPAHYKVGGIETIDFIEAKGLNYRLGNVVKYVTRADHKGDRLENLRKAKWYLEREIAAC